MHYKIEQTYNLSFYSFYGNSLMQEKSFLEKNFALLYCSGVAVSFLFMLWYADHQLVHGDQWQMLQKGYIAAYTGHWIHYGNVASGFFHVMGSFLTAAVALPLMLVDSPWSPMVFVLFLRICAFLLIDAVLKNMFKPAVRLGFLVIFLFSPWILFESILYNPSYLAFCAALHLFTAYKMKDKKSIVYMLLHVLSIGVALQCHNSWIILPLISCYLWYRNIIKISWIGVFLGSALVLISLIPFAIELMHNSALQVPQHRDNAHSVFFGFTHVYPILKAIIYWLRYASLLFSNKIVTRANFDFLSDISWLQWVMHYLWMVVVFAIGCVTVVFSAKINWRLWVAIKGKIKRSHIAVGDKDWLALYAVGGFIAMIIGAGLSPIIFNYWHLSLVMITAMIPMIFFMSHYIEKKPKKFVQYLTILALYFFVVNLNASLNSFKYSYDANYSAQVEEGIQSIQRTR